MPGPKDLQQLFYDFRTLADITAYVLLIGFFYLNYYVLIPELYFKKRLRDFVLIVIGCYLVIVLLPGFFVPMGPPPDDPPPRGHLPDPFFKFGRNLFLFLGVLFFSLMVRINNRLRQAEKEKLNAEVSYLKAQINPHFLFNTLNSIYSLALQKSEQTAAAVVKLSNMMRYVITDAAQEFVPMEKEIDYLHNYIELQQLRFGSSLSLKFHVHGESNGKKIAPLLLIPLVENAFKYGVNPEEPSTITIEVRMEPQELYLQIENRKVNVQHTEKTGLGIANVQKRLDLLYPAKYVLTVNEHDTTFSVSLLLIIT